MTASRWVLLAAGSAAVTGAALGGFGIYLLALGAVILAGVGLLRRPQRGVLLLAGLVPFDGLLDLLPHSSSLHSWKDILVALTLAATFTAPAEARAARGRRLPRWWPALAGLLVIAVASAAAVRGNQAVTGLRIGFFYLLVAWAIWRCPLNDRERDLLVSVLLVTGILTAVFGLAQEVVGPDRLHALGYPYNTTLRFTGGHLRAFATFTYQAPFAYFLMVVSLLGLSQLMTEPKRLRNRLFALSMPAVLGGLFFTFERGAWLGLAAGCLYLGLRHYRLLLLAVPLGAVGFLYLPASVSVATLSSSSLAERSTGWGANFAQILAHPLGVGVGATGAAAARVAALQVHGATALAAAVYQPDNYYFKTAYELGVLGLWMLVMLLVAVLLDSDRAALVLADRDAGLAAGVTAFILAAMVASTVSTFLEIFPMDVFTWVLVTVVATQAARSGVPGTDRPPKL